MKIPAANPVERRQNPPWRFWPWLVVLAVILSAGFIRIRLLDMPLERDEGEYAYAGQLILQGIPPYELAYNMKLPGTYYAYAAGMAVFGQTSAGVHLTLLVVNSLTCVFIFLLGRKLSGVTGGLTAAAGFAVMSLSPAVLGMAAHATQFVVLFAVPGVLLLWNALASGERRTFFFSGLMFGLAFLMKQPGLCFGLFALVMMTCQAVRSRAGSSRDFLPALSCFGAGLALPFGFFCLAALVAGDFGRFWFWTFSYAAHYATGASLTEGAGWLGDYIREQFPVYAGFGILAAAGLLAGLRLPEKRRAAAFVAVFFIFSFLGTMPGLHFRKHYFVFLLPALGLMAGLAVESVGTFFPSRRWRFLPLVPVVLALAWNLCLQRREFFQMTPEQVCQQIYHDNPFLASLPAAQYIREHSLPDARMAVVGSEPQLYFYAGRHSATGYIYTYPLMEAQPFARQMQLEMINEIEAAKPEFIVLVMYDLSWLRLKTSDPTIFRWAGEYTHEFYEPVATVGQHPDDQIVWFSGKVAGDATNSLERSMVIYQRKPGAD